MDLSVSRVGEGVASAIASGVGDGAGRASSLRAATPIKFKAVRRINVLISNRFLLAGPRPVKIFDKQPDGIAPQLFFGCLLSWRNDVDRYDCSHPKRWSRNRALTIPDRLHPIHLPATARLLQHRHNLNPATLLFAPLKCTQTFPSIEPH